MEYSQGYSGLNYRRIGIFNCVACSYK